jgi:hypothetical protein
MLLRPSFLVGLSALVIALASKAGALRLVTREATETVLMALTGYWGKRTIGPFSSQCRDLAPM